MKPKLPPPDPHESVGMGPTRNASFTHPVMVFVEGPPAVRDERIASAILDLRPGVLIVCATG
jgi:hypothetical protein